MKKTFIFLFTIVLSLVFIGCSDDDDNTPTPIFSEISVSPQKDVYHIGDKIQLTVSQLTETPTVIKAAKYWFYYDYATKAMFVTPTTDTNEFISPEITLTKTGDVELSFWAQYDYTQYRYDGVTKRIILHVIE